MDTDRVGQQRRVALLVEYEGTNYAGFQLQDGPATVQGELEKALERFTGQQIRIRGASRTDSGTHAKGQVVDFITSTKHPTERFPSALNYYLPKDINVLEAQRVCIEFNARRWALSRTYRYNIINRQTPSPLRRLTHLWIKENLDVVKMANAAQYLVGIHDFRAVAIGLPEDRSAVREVMRWEVNRFEETIVIECEATGFLKHQIRKVNGILTEIGRGKYSTTKMLQALDGERSTTPILAAHGLCLISVKYPSLIRMGREKVGSE